MSRFFVLFIALFFLTFCAFSQSQTGTTPDAPPQVRNIFQDRMGFLVDINYGFVQWLQIRKTSHPKWSVIGPDIGMIFFNNIGGYRELWIGAGFEIRPVAPLTIDHEAYFEQATGPDGHGKTWYLPWTRVQYNFPKKFVAESAFFPYLPLNGGNTQFVIERAKLEYRGLNRFNFGGGYGAHQTFNATQWQSRPFATATLKTEHLGNFEVWVQAFSHDGFQLQYRHSLAWHTHH
jgi:hypothetical protein